MKIESQVYTRYSTEAPSLGTQRGKNNGIQPQKSNAAQKPTKTSQIRATHKAGSAQAVTASHKAQNNIPSALSDVITAEERAMLQQIFPEKGAKWGEAAYKSADSSLNNFSVGSKLDLMS